MPRSERARGRARLLVVPCAVGLLAWPSAAHAGTVTRIVEPGFEGSTPVTNVLYVYRASSRQANRVRVRLVQSGGNGVVMSDRRGTVTPGVPDCAPRGARAARCIAPSSIGGRRTGAIRVRVETGDRDDRVRIGSGVSAAVELGTGDDRALGGHGGLTAFGRSGADIIRSGRGADVLDGGRGRDLLDAGPGDDILRGGRGDDRLFGGAGRDRLEDGSGLDRVFGDSGADRIRPRGSRRGVQGVSCGRGRDLVLGPDRFVNLGRDCELAETGRGDRLFVRPLRVQDRALVFLAGCAERGCRGSGRAGAAVSVRLGARPPGRGRLLGRRRYRVGLLGSESVFVRLSLRELALLKNPTSLEIHAAGMAYRVLIRVR